MSAIGKVCPLKPYPKTTTQVELQYCDTDACAWWSRGGDCAINVIAEMLLKDYENMNPRTIREK